MADDDKSPKLLDDKDPAIGSADKRDDGLTGDPREGQPQGDGRPPEPEDDKDEAKKPASKSTKKG